MDEQKKPRLITTFADLGHAVPDTVLVETAAYCPRAVEREGAA